MFRRPSIRRTARLRRLVVATVAAAAVPAALAHSAAPADSHAFPRTYHIFSCSSPSALARYDMMTGYHYCDLKTMRSLNPNGIFLLVPGLDPSKGGQRTLGVTYGSGSEGWDGRCDTISDGQAASLGCIPAFDPYWDALHNADGSLAQVGGYSHGGFNLADPTNKRTPEKIAKIFTYGAKQASLYGRGWNGVHSDNWTYGSIGQSWYYGPNLDTDRDGGVDDQTVLRRNWDTGLAKVGHLIRSYLPGMIVSGNGNSFRPELYSGAEVDGWLRSANSTQIEHMQRDGRYNNPGALIAIARRWLDYPDPYGQTRYMSVLQDAPSCSGGDLKLPSGADPNSSTYVLSSCVLKAMRWGLTASLLADVYYEIYPYGFHGANWWYDEYDGGEGIRSRGYLGKALGEPRQLANGVWRRDFVSGIALNNSTSSTQTVSLEATYKRLKGTQNPSLNNGALVTSVSIPGHDGTILLRYGDPRIAGTRVTARRHRVLVKVWAVRCQPCQARLRLQSGRRLRVAAMRPAGQALVGFVRNVPSGVSRYQVVLVDRDSGRRAASRWRPIRVP